MLTIVHNATKKLTAKQIEENEINLMKQIILQTEREEMSTEEALETFRVNFPLTRCNVQEKSISYRIQNYATAKSFQDMAETLIKTYSLPLRVNTWSADASRGTLIIESK